jgi:hypothetical protein
MVLHISEVSSDFFARCVPKWPSTYSPNMYLFPCAYLYNSASGLVELVY